jgi:hypothetical protein
MVAYLMLFYKPFGLITIQLLLKIVVKYSTLKTFPTFFLNTGKFRQIQYPQTVYLKKE